MGSNPVVIDLLEAYLEAARKGNFDSVAIAMTGYPDRAALDFAGDVVLEKATREALGLLVDRVDESIAIRALPKPNPQLGYDYAVYNCMEGPLGFDYLVWLIYAEMIRRRAGAPAPLKVAFWMGSKETGRLSLRDRHQWVDGVFRPALCLIGAVEDPTAMRGHSHQVYVTRPIVEAARHGQEIPRLGPPQAGHQHITITLREADHEPARNSNLDAWLRFAVYLGRIGERVTIIRDYVKAHEPLGHYLTNPLHSTDLMSRMDLYESAKANLFVSNGPTILAIFGSRPWLQFVRDADGTPEFWRDKIGLSPGEQYPWSAPDQRVIWKPDAYDNIVSAWDEHFGSIEAAA